MLEIYVAIVESGPAWPSKPLLSLIEHRLQVLEDAIHQVRLIWGFMNQLSQDLVTI